MQIRCKINGKKFCGELDGTMRLLDFLRLELGLTGAKEGCGEGECGACAVLLDDKAVNSCLLVVSQIQGREIMTIEGLSGTVYKGLDIAQLQQLFIECGAVQCGFCSPGMTISAVGLLLTGTNFTESEIRAAIAGNLCRCGGYKNIIRAILLAQGRCVHA